MNLLIYGCTLLWHFVGCGSGLSGETLSENGHEWIGLDISQSMLSESILLYYET